MAKTLYKVPFPVNPTWIPAEPSISSNDVVPYEPPPLSTDKWSIEEIAAEAKHAAAAKKQKAKKEPLEWPQIYDIEKIKALVKDKADRVEAAKVAQKDEVKTLGPFLPYNGPLLAFDDETTSLDFDPPPKMSSKHPKLSADKYFLPGDMVKLIPSSDKTKHKYYERFGISYDKPRKLIKAYEYSFNLHNNNPIGGSANYVWVEDDKGNVTKGHCATDFALCDEQGNIIELPPEELKVV